MIVNGYCNTKSFHLSTYLEKYLIINFSWFKFLINDTCEIFFLTLSHTHTQSGRGGRGIKLLTLSNPKQKYLQPYISLFIYNKHICLPYFILTATHIFVTRTSDI